MALVLLTVSGLSSGWGQDPQEGNTNSQAPVRIERLPEPGLQPQTVRAADGTVHLIYLVGEPVSSDIVYRRRIKNASWSDSIKVNSQRGSAIAIGTIRGPHMALSQQGRVHVIWNGSQSAEPKSRQGGSPLLYARLNKDGSSFSSQRNLMTATHELDGGGSVAVGTDGRVFAFWHASPAGSHGETNRAVFLALSTDEGRTFQPEQPVSPPGTGACGCCGLAALADARGGMLVLFRGARSAGQRDIMLLASADQTDRFRQAFTHPWPVGTCPMSSAGLANGAQGTWAAWETAGRVYLSRLSESGGASPRAVGPSKGAKHPRLATNARGETLMVWTEGTGWQRGGGLAWQVFDVDGQPTAERGRADGIPPWTYAAAFAEADGRFVVVY